MSLVELFCDVDDFCQTFLPACASSNWLMASANGGVPAAARPVKS